MEVALTLFLTKGGILRCTLISSSHLGVRGGKEDTTMNTFPSANVRIGSRASGLGSFSEAAQWRDVDTERGQDRGCFSGELTTRKTRKI